MGNVKIDAYTNLQRILAVWLEGNGIGRWLDSILLVHYRTRDILFGEKQI